MTINKKSLLTILSVLLTAVIFVACETEQMENEREVRTVNVETEILKPDTFESFLRQVGTVTSIGDVVVAAEVTGVVEEVLKREGDRVEKDETIIRLDSKSLTQEVRRLEAATSQSRENYERLRRLYENDNIGSEIDVLNARYTYEQNLSSLESARINLENSRIKAPFSGIIENVMAERGAMVAGGTQVFRIVSDEDKKIRLGIPARFSNAIDMGDEAEVWFEFDSEKRYYLPISFIGKTIDSRNRTFRVDINLPPDMRDVKVEMIANVRVKTEHLDDVILVNEEFIFQKDNSYVVYITGENEEGEQVASEKVVQLGSSFANRSVITEGLKLGDELITMGSSYLEDGTRIELVEDRNPELSSRNKEIVIE